ncbi:MAG: hypothetical protein KAJ51_10915 [Thermoplasmata archaeon]|nr:hypothetical protein [Thermoplasmata archaeon]
MAVKEATQTRALTGPRQLTQMIPEYAGEMGASEFPGFKGWIASPSTSVVYYETYFDLSGYALDDLTAIPVSATLQDPGLYACTDTKVGLQVLDVISQERLDAGRVLNDLVTDNNAPGMMMSPNNFEQITFGNYRLFMGQLSFTSPSGLASVVYLPADGMNFGSGDAVTVEKLWCYRFVMARGATEASTSTIQIPASRFILNITVLKEKELEYIMRLKRSYELAQDD